MKLAKRIIVVVLSLAILASVLVLSVTAGEGDDGFRFPGANSPDDILEYYINEDYLADNYESGEWSSEFEIDKAYDITQDKYKDYPPMVVEIIDDPTGLGEGKVLSHQLQRSKGASYAMGTEDKSSLTDSVFVSFDIYVPKASANKLNYQLKAGVLRNTMVESTDAEGNEVWDYYVDENGEYEISSATTRATIFGISYIEGEVTSSYDADGNKRAEAITNTTPVFYYSIWNAEQKKPAFRGTTYCQIFDGMTPEYDTWYDIAICIDSKSDNYYFIITNSKTGESVQSPMIDMKGCAGVWGFECIGKYTSKTSNSDLTAESGNFYLDNMEIYEGSFRRAPAYKEEYTSTHLEDLKNYYTANIANLDARIEVADVLDYLYNQCDTDNFSEALRAELPEAYTYINQTYADKFLSVVDAINTSLSYNERLKHAEYIAEWEARVIPNDEIAEADGLADYYDRIVAAREKYADERADLVVVKDHSDKFIALMAQYEAWMAETDESTTNKDYAALDAFYNEAASENYTRRDEKYEGIPAANEIFAGLEAKVLRMRADVAAFLEGAQAMQDSTTFGPLYAAYLVTYESYNKYNEEYAPGIINPDFDKNSHQDVAASLAYYEENEPIILQKAFECDEFNRIVREASIASYYTSVVELLAEADEAFALINVDYQNDYPGIADSIEMHNNLKDATANAENAADAYINAVNIIEGKVTFAAKQAAIKSALALKEHGDILGYAGVTEANVKLAKAEQEINVLLGNSNTLIATVEKLEKATTIAERRVLIAVALKAAAGAEASVTGVTEAKAALDAAITAFDAEIEAANNVLTSAIEKAQAIVSTVDNSAIFVAGSAE